MDEARERQKEFEASAYAHRQRMILDLQVTSVMMMVEIIMMVAVLVIMVMDDDDANHFLTTRISKRAKMNSGLQPAKLMPKSAKLEARLLPLWRRRMPLEEKLKKRGKTYGPR